MSLNVSKLVALFGFALFLTSFFAYGNNEAFAQTTDTCGLVLVSRDSIFYNDLQSGEISKEAISTLSNPGNVPAILSVQGTDWQDASKTSVIDVSKTRLSFLTGIFASKTPLSLAFQDIRTLQPSVNTNIFWQLEANLLNPSFTGDLTQVMTFRVECGSVATMVFDTFTESSNTDITAHTPDTGTGWTEEYNTALSTAQVQATNDILEGGEKTNRVGDVYSAQPNPTVAEYDITFTIKAVDDSGGRKPIGIIARWTDDNNFYYLRMTPTGSDDDDLQLWKYVDGTATQLDSLEDITWAVDDVIKFEVRDATKKVFVNGVEKLT